MDNALPALAIVLGAVFLAIVVSLLSPARVVAELDTDAGSMSLRVAILWGLVPAYTYKADKPGKRGTTITNIVAHLQDVPRITHALLAAPKLIPTLLKFWKRLQTMKPEVSRMDIGLNLVDPRANIAIGVAERLFKSHEAHGLALVRRDHPGVGLRASVKVYASLFLILAAAMSIGNAPPMREFARRLAKPGPNKNLNVN